MMNATEIESKARDARAAAGRIATVSTDVKNACLLDLAGRLDEQVDSILAANALDMGAAESGGVGDAKLRRLKLTEESVHQIAGVCCLQSARARMCDGQGSYRDRHSDLIGTGTQSPPGNDVA